MEKEIQFFSAEASGDIRVVVQRRRWDLWGGGCRRVVDLSELGVAVPKIRELSKVPTVVLAQRSRCLRSLWG